MDVPSEEGDTMTATVDRDGTTEAQEAAAVAPVADDGQMGAAEDELARKIAEQARADGLRLTGPGGLLGRVTKRVLEAALDGEMDAHLGYARHDPAGRDGGNSRNGYRAKTVLTDIGPVEIEVPRDRDSSFQPQIVAKRQRRLTGVDDLVISLVAKGLTTGEVQAHLAEIYGAQVSRETISHITDQVLDGMAEWQNRPLDPVYAVLFIDAINVKIRDGQVANRPIYTGLAVTADGERDILGLWAGEHGDGEGAKYWLRVLTEIKNRGAADVLMVVCDGLKGLPEAIAAVWPAAVTQACIVHLLRNSFRYASKRDWAAIAKDLKPIYTAASEAEALERFAEFGEKWEKRYPAIIRLWENAWAEFVPFLAFDKEIRTVICTTNAIESINARFRRSVKARGHFPNEQAALKHLYLVIVSLDPTGRGRQRWSNRWKAALNAFDITFDGRLSKGRK
jgi:putative transposase